MKPSEIFRENAENCAQLAEAEPTANGPAYKRYKRMEAAWRSLTEEQEWLDGEVPPAKIAAPNAQKKPPRLSGHKRPNLVSSEPGAGRSIYFLVAPNGGIRPAQRRRSRLALTREVISRGVARPPWAWIAAAVSS
jgi:hypothetical protein